MNQHYPWHLYSGAYITTHDWWLSAQTTPSLCLGLILSEVGFNRQRVVGWNFGNICPWLYYTLLNGYDWLLLRYCGRERSTAWGSSGIWKIMRIANKSDQNLKSKLRHFGGWLNLNWTLKIKESDLIHALFTRFLDRAKADPSIYRSNGKVGTCWWSQVTRCDWARYDGTTFL